ncbi:cox-type terminal oxidase subunit I [Natronomonas pharaonis DSM 2160]|uniref:Cox-type terminal oxidase subunit I n=1 Tax=Natronomonas pharaonis (strain ATCC 35678 / DSM 2160 / CIP 103997 / JCM 8858 / NBRC 14720 / NCIMB 2260 / Gabara) TaxID=348780 RepID=A0A1U7EYE5_NATPD|nr:cbb3-type cytochrome c oxidase subunit I [Natronomonas pharaonis]CAI50239.1 cox-type terminal oxidase subunit I [Natronomonas pharaonis DSM 2160]
MVVSKLFSNDYGDDGVRTCSVTGLDIHRSAERHVKLFGLTAVIALVIGGIFAVSVALTRWELISLIPEDGYYTHLSLHAWNILIFWMVFMEIAILYVGGLIVLGRRLPLTKLAKAGWITMVAGAVGVNWSIWTATQRGQEAPLLTAYVPLDIPVEFYASAIVFLLGATIAALPFFVAIWKEKRGAPNKTLPLVAFGAFITSIIAVEAILGGLVAFGYALVWQVGIIDSINTGIYRQLYWIIGHGSQQINLLALITVWYFLTHVVGGAVVVSEKVSRSAFVLYLFFINLGAAHHLMVDPGVSVGWRIFNTSYAFYGAAFASMIHAFAIPAGLEAGRRQRGLGGGLFGWLTSGPWKNPVFSATIFSIILFGFMGGITGVLMGQLQLNMTWHNTFATVGHFHGTVALGTTLAFMGLVFFVIRTMFQRSFVTNKLASLVPYFYAGAMGIAVLMMMYVGILYGVPRRTSSVVRDIPGTDFSLAAAEPLFLILGPAAVLAIIAGALFVVVAVLSLLFGDRLEEGDNDDMLPDGGLRPDGGVDVHAVEMRGTFTLCLIFMATFIVLYVLNWYLLTQVWHIGA